MYQIFNTAQNDEDNRICLHKLPTSLIIEFDAPVYIINIFQSAKLKKKKRRRRISLFLHERYLQWYIDIRYQLSNVERSQFHVTWTNRNLEQSLLSWRNYCNEEISGYPKNSFYFFFFRFSIIFPKFRSIVSQWYFIIYKIFHTII